MPRAMNRSDYLWLVAIFTGLTASAFGFGVYLFGTIVPDMQGDLALDPQTTGIASGFAQAGFMASALFAGLFARKFGLFRTIVAFQALSTTCLFLIALCNDRVILIALLSCLGISAAAIWVPMIPAVQQIVPKARRGAVLGTLASGTAYGVLVNGLWSPLIVSEYGWRRMWIVTGCIAAALLVLLISRLRFLRLLDNCSHEAEEQKAGKRKPRLELASVLLIAITLLSGLAFLPFQTYLTSFFRNQYNWSMASAASLWTLIGVGGMVGGTTFGFLADKISAKWALVIAFSALCASCIVVILTSDAIPSFIAALAFGLAYNAVFGLTGAYISKTFSYSNAGLISGFTSVALGFGSMIGNYGGGWLIEVAGDYRILYTVVSVLVAVNVVASIALPRESSVGEPKGVKARSATST